MPFQQSSLDEMFGGTFRRLFDTIERGTEQCTRDRLQTLLEENRGSLALGLDAFALPCNESRSKITGTPTVSVSGKTIKLQPPEKDLICQLSDFMQLDELHCAFLWDAYRNEHSNYKVESSGDYRLSDDRDLITCVAMFYYDDRLALLQCICSLLRISYDRDHPFSDIAKTAVKKIIDDVRDSAAFIDRLILQLKRLTRLPVPPQCFSIANWENVWAKQNLEEQKAIVEIISLIHLAVPCTPQRVLTIVQEFEASDFCTVQASNFALNEEACALRLQLSYLCVLLVVEILALPYLKPEYTIQNVPTGATLIESPNIIAKINLIAMYFGDKPIHAPFLFAWSYFLSYIHDAFSTLDAIPSAYAEVQSVISGTQEVSESQLLTSRPLVNDRDQLSDRRTPSIKQAPNMFGSFAGRAIKLQVFNVISDILESSLCEENDANNFGYRSIIRGLLNSFMNSTPVVCLPEESYNSLVRCVALLYDNQPDLCYSFWKNDYDPTDSESLLSFAASRFPMHATDIITLLPALCGGKSDDELARESPAKVFEYLRSLNTITLALKNTAALIPSEKPHIVHTDVPIPVTSGDGCLLSLVIPAGTEGEQLTSTLESSSVRWNLKYSGWHLLVAILQGLYKPVHMRGSPHIYDPDEQLSGRNIHIVNGILELIRKVLENNSKLTYELVVHIEQGCLQTSTANKCPALITVLCNVLNYCCSAHNCPVPTITSTLRCLTALIPFYRYEIWAYLETAPILPRPNSDYHLASQFCPCSSAMTSPSSQIQHIVSNVEITTGSYTLLLAFLNLVTALARDIQRNWWTDHQNDALATSKTLSPSQKRVQYQVNVLYFCLHFLMVEIFSDFSEWRYQSFVERFLIGSKTLNIFTEVVQFFKGPNEGFGLTLTSLRDELLKNFLHNEGSYHITPLLDIILDGASTANNLYHIGRVHEARRAEKLTENALSFVKLLLKRQLEQCHEQDAPRESTLERLLLGRSSDGRAPDFLLSLMRHIQYRHNIRIPTLATDVISLLCRSTASWKTRPNFVQYLGNADHVRAIIRSYIVIASDVQQNERLLSSVWQMISLLLEYQPGIAVLFLESGENIMQSPKSAIQRVQGSLTPATTNEAGREPGKDRSAIQAAVDILVHWQSLADQKPTVLSNVLRCITKFWQTSSDHYALVQQIRSDTKLWQTLGDILLNSSNIMQPQGEVVFEKPAIGLDEDIESTPSHIVSNQDRNVRRLCCMRVCISLAMRIISLEVHLTSLAKSGNNDYKASEKLPVALKDLLLKIFERNKLSLLRNQLLKSNYDPVVHSQVEQSATALLALVNVRDSMPLLQKVTQVGWGDDEQDGEGRQYGDSYTYDLQLSEARVQSLCDDTTIKSIITDQHKDAEARAQMMSNVRKKAVQFLSDLCRSNHNSSVVDADAILMQAFVTLVETCSSDVGDLIWSDKNPTAAQEFIHGLIALAQQDKRTDGVALVVYESIIGFIRSLTQDWVKRNQNCLKAPNPLQEREVSDQTYMLLSKTCELLERENFAIMYSVRSYTIVAFHRPLLEAIMLCLQIPELQRPPAYLLDVVCSSFQVLAYKAIAFGSTPEAQNSRSNDECIKDLTVVTSLLERLENRKCFGPTEWHRVFEHYETIPALHMLLERGIELMVKELDTNPKQDTIVITPYAEIALYYILRLSLRPWAAKMLMEHNITDLLCNNMLAELLQAGCLNVFIKFETGEAGSNPVERNPLHIVWTYMIAVVSNLFQTLGDEEAVIRSVTGFVQTYGQQISKAFSYAHGSNDASLGLTPSESLSTPVLEEIERLTMVFFCMSKNRNRLSQHAISLLMVYKDYALQLLQRYLYLFTHPAHLQAQLYPIDEVEKYLAQTLSDVHITLSKDERTHDRASTKLVQLTMERTVRIMRNIVATLVLLTEAQDVIVEQETARWPFSKTILYPSMLVTFGESASFGTMNECVNAGLSLLKTWEGQPELQKSMEAMMNIVQGAVVLMSTQMLLWIAKPSTDNNTRRDIATDSFTDVTETVDRVAAWESKRPHSPGVITKVLKTLHKFATRTSPTQ